MQIKLAGFIGSRFGKEYNLSVKTPNEAIRALCQLVPGFRSFLTAAHERGIYFQIITSNTAAGEGIPYDDLGLGCQSFTLVPVITGNIFGLFGGGGGGGFLGILLGVALVAFAMTGFGVVTWGAAGTISAGVQTAVAALGMGLIFTGVSSLLSPGTPTQKNKQETAGADDAISRGSAPVAVNGAAVPLLYGTYLASNMPVIAAYIDNNEGYYLGLISEGEIVGFPNGVGEDLYLDGLVASSSLITNVELTDGSQTTKVIDIVKSAGFNIPINVPFNAQGGDFDEDDNLFPNTQVTRSFSNKLADTVLLRFSVGPVYQTKQKSDSGGTDSSFKNYDEDEGGGVADNPTHLVVQILDGDGVVVIEDDLIFRKTTSNKLEEYDYDIKGEKSPISIRVSRVDRKGPRPPETDIDDDKQKQWSWVKSPVTWISADITWQEDLVYPYSSLLALKFKAGEFGQMPKVQTLIKGLKVPTLSSSLTVTYAHSSNPAYILLDLLTNPRYGAGYRTYTINGATRIQAGIHMRDCDLASFKNAADYCDDKKITFNAYINKDADALQLFRGIASSFQAQIVYAGGFITLVVDKKHEVDADGKAKNIRIYSAANTIGGDTEEEAAPHFSYEGTARRSRSTAVEVSYIDSTEFYEEKKTLIEDADFIDRYGYNLTQVRALGCTSEKSAKRLARYVLASNTLSTDTVSFKVGPDGAMLLPGDLCLILDPLKTRMECGGRLKTVGTNNVLLDRPLTDGPNYSSGKFYLYTYSKSGVAFRHKVSSVNKAGGLVQVEANFGADTVPAVMDMWALVREGDTQKPKEPLYRVQTVKENGDNTYTVIAIKYDKTKFDFVDGDGEISPPSYTSRFSSGINPSIKPQSISFQIRGKS